MSPRALLLVGYGGSGHPGAYLADAIALVLADLRLGTLWLISVPRDLLVGVPEMLGDDRDLAKLNAILSFARARLPWPRALRTLEAIVGLVTGLHVSASMAVDFEGFARIVDQVGGIDVEIPAAFTARYPTANAGWELIHFPVGVVHLNGAESLRLARARYLDLPGPGDFVRARHQRALLRAIATQRRPLQFLLAFWHARPHLHGTVSVTDTTYFLAALARHPQIRELSLDDHGDLIPIADPELGAILAPRSGSYAEVRKRIRETIKGGSLRVE